MTKRRRGWDPSKPEIELYADELAMVQDWEYYKQMSAGIGKPLKIIPRPPVPPLNPLVTTREALRDVNEYERLQAKAKQEGKTLCIED